MTHALKATALASAAIGALALVAVLATPRVGATYPTGSPGGFAGSNVDDGVVRTCATSGCHDSYPLNSGTGGVSIDVPTGVQPGQTVTVTVTVNNTTTGAEGSETGPRQGFEAAVSDASGMSVGVLTITDAAHTRKTFGGDPTITQTIGGTTVSSWTFDWTAPDAPAEVTFYAAGNAANGGSLPGQGNNASGDYIYTTTAPVLVNTTATDDAPHAQARLTLSAPHPNPVRTGATAVRLTLPEAGPVRVRLVDGRGRTVRRVLDERRAGGASDVLVRTDELAPGLYFVVAEAAGRRTVQPVSVVR